MGDESTGSNFLIRLIVHRPISVALLIYVALCIPVYIWIEGPTGDFNYIGPDVVLITLGMGSVMFVPIIMMWLRKIKLNSDYVNVPELE